MEEVVLSLLRELGWECLLPLLLLLLLKPAQPPLRPDEILTDL
jgi:hypothetical protein